MKIKLGVIFGGETVEHEVSIISALQAIKSIDKTKYDVVPLYIAKDRTWYYGNILKDIDTYKDFNNVKKYLKKVVL
jgi:D-alanine-D-alanine ligase